QLATRQGCNSFDRHGSTDGPSPRPIQRRRANEGRESNSGRANLLTYGKTASSADQQKRIVHGERKLTATVRGKETARHASIYDGGRRADRMHLARCQGDAAPCWVAPNAAAAGARLGSFWEGRPARAGRKPFLGSLPRHK